VGDKFDNKRSNEELSSKFPNVAYNVFLKEADFKPHKSRYSLNVNPKDPKQLSVNKSTAWFSIFSLASADLGVAES
jgi:hypothetical protein